MNERMSRYETLFRVSQMFEWKKWMKEIPYIKFPGDWEVKAVPPFLTGVIRYFIKNGNGNISVYLDCYELGGYHDGPYWEVHPYNGDCFRCSMDETDILIEDIQKIKDGEDTDE